MPMLPLLLPLWKQRQQRWQHGRSSGSSSSRAVAAAEHYFELPCSITLALLSNGSAKPISIKKIYYGLHEIPIMRKCIASLAKLSHICQIYSNKLLFKALLAPKPHQEHINNIDDFVWQF
jgi:hypothetical protein